MTRRYATRAPRLPGSGPRSQPYRDPADRPAALPDCYDYVRRYYGVPAYIGVRVKLASNGREGVLVRGRRADQYLYILLDGDTRHSGPYHPTDGIEYLVQGAGA